jgi:hypothetical protein
MNNTTILAGCLREVQPEAMILSFPDALPGEACQSWTRHAIQWRAAITCSAPRRRRMTHSWTPSVRTRLGTGVLFQVDHTSCAGHGRGTKCAVCDLPINHPELEYQVGGPSDSVCVHLPCYLVWRQESKALRVSEGTRHPRRSTDELLAQLRGSQTLNPKGQPQEGGSSPSGEGRVWRLGPGSLTVPP